MTAYIAAARRSHCILVLIKIWECCRTLLSAPTCPISKVCTLCLQAGMEWNEEVRAGFTMQWVDTEPRLPNEAPSGTAASLSPPTLLPFPLVCAYTHTNSLTHTLCVADIYTAYVKVRVQRLGLCVCVCVCVCVCLCVCVCVCVCVCTHALKPKPSTLNPKPSTLNPEPEP